MCKTIFPVLLLAALAAATARGAPIYSCDHDGHKVFSQQPCGDDAKVVQDDKIERSVKLGVDMSVGDIGYLCSLSMRAWEKQAQDRRNSSAGGYRYDGAYDTGERRRTFVLSHIENLEQIAVNDPELYDIAKSISMRSFNGSTGSYLYDAERARAQKQCVRDMQASMERVRARREAEDNCRYRQENCRWY